jgi:hypothetical protein
VHCGWLRFAPLCVSSCTSLSSTSRLRLFFVFSCVATYAQFPLLFRLTGGDPNLFVARAFDEPPAALFRRSAAAHLAACCISPWVTLLDPACTGKRKRTQAGSNCARILCCSGSSPPCCVRLFVGCPIPLLAIADRVCVLCHNAISCVGEAAWRRTMKCVTRVLKSTTLPF